MTTKPSLPPNPNKYKNNFTFQKYDQKYIDLQIVIIIQKENYSNQIIWKIIQALT